MYKNKMNYDLTDNDYVQKDEFVNTNGINLLEILTLRRLIMPYIFKWYLWNLWVMEIEAARTVLMNEIKEVIDNLVIILT